MPSLAPAGSLNTFLIVVDRETLVRPDHPVLVVDRFDPGAEPPGCAPFLPGGFVHPRLTELLDYAELQRAALLAALEAVPQSLWTRRPDPEAWSVAEVLEHLHRVEVGIGRLVRRRLEEACAAGLVVETEAGSLLGSLDRFGLVERRKLVTAPEPVQPKGALPPAEAVAALASSRRVLRAAAAAGDGLALGTVHAPHVLLGPLTLYEWILFVGQHEARHAAQIREIARRLAPALTLE